MTTDERVKEIREAATQSAQNHPWVEYVTFLLTELDAARAREATVEAERDAERQRWMDARSRELAEALRADASEARETRLRDGGAGIDLNAVVDLYRGDRLAMAHAIVQLRHAAGDLREQLEQLEQRSVAAGKTSWRRRDHPASTPPGISTARWCLASHARSGASVVPP